VLFALDVTLQQGWTVLTVTGELELATAPQLRQRVVGLVAEGRTRIVLDLAGVDFADSVGLGVIVAALKRVRGRDGELAVAGAVPRVRRLFEITRLDEIVELFPDVDAALAALGPAEVAAEKQSRSDGG
jgi:anti-sigma B factor antagonist